MLLQQLIPRAISMGHFCGPGILYMHSLWLPAADLEVEQSNERKCSKALDELPVLAVDFPVVRSESTMRLHLNHLQEGLVALNEAIRLRGAQPIWSIRNEQLWVASGPFVSWSLPDGPGSMLVRCLARHRNGAVRFLMDMVTRWLNPTHSLSIQSAHGCEFRFVDCPDHIWVWMELVVRLETAQDVESARLMLPQLEKEILLGLQSSAHASRLLEMKGMSHDEKVVAIQERITQIMAQRPQQFSADLMHEMQFFLAASRDEFRMIHKASHLTRMILASYYFRRVAKLQQGSSRRTVQVKVLPTTVQNLDGVRSVLGVMIAIFPMQSHERFEESHLIAAIRTILPQAEIVPGSFLYRSGRPSGLCVIYLDIACREGSFDLADRRALRQQLGGRVGQSIAQLLPPMFMPRNEEEVMRHIVTLSQQLRYVSDVPQVVVSFERQTGSNLIFTVVVLRLQKSGKPSMESLLNRTDLLSGNWSFERRRLVGLLRKRHPKEASILRVTVPSEPFLRQDHSVNLVQARCVVVADLEKMIGPIRDYNGGMLQQQRLVLEEARSQLGALDPMEQNLLESFFHAIAPGERRALLQAEVIATWFRAFQELRFCAEQMPNGEHMRYDDGPNVFWALVFKPEPDAHLAFKEISDLVAQNRGSVLVQLSLPGYSVFGVLTMSDNQILREALHRVFVTR